MAQFHPKITQTELQVMEALWSRGPLSSREISESIYGANGTVQHATVNSLLGQLETKKLVDRDRTGFAHRFSARVDKATFVGHQLQEIADNYFGGALTPTLLALVERIRLTAKDRDAIRKIIEQIE